MSTKARVAALDPTALEQSGLDPQQIQKEIDAAVRQAVSQAQNTSSSAPGTSVSQTQNTSASPSSSPPPSYSVSSTATPSRTNPQVSPKRQNLGAQDPTYLGQTGLDPQQVAKQVEAAVRSAVQPLTTASSQSGSSPAARRPSILDIISRLDTAAADQSLVDNFYNIMKNIQLTVWTSGGPPSGGSKTDDRDYAKGRGLWGSSSPPSGAPGTSAGQDGSSQSPRFTAPISPDYLLDQRNPVNVVNRLSDAYASLKSQLEQTVSKYGDVLQYSGDKIDISPQLQALLSRYDQALKELKNLPNVENALRDKFGNYVSVSGGKVDLAPSVKTLIDRANEFALLYSYIQQNYNSAFFDLVKRYGLRVEGNTLVVPPDKYDQVKAEIEALNRKMQDDLAKLYDQYRDVVNKRVVDGKTVYEYKPEVQAAAALQIQVAQTVGELAAAQQKALQDVLSRYGDVLSYDKATGKITPSKELEEMLSRYAQATQEVGKLTSAMSTVAGMLPAFAQQLPALTVKFQTYDKTQNKWVETGGETPIYIKDENLRKEIMDWMSQNKDKVKVAAFYDPSRPVVYVYNDRNEGYIINPVTGEVRRAKGVSGMVDDTAKAMWYNSLTDKEKKELEKWLEVQRRREEVEQMPPGLRELYAALMGAGQFAVISPAIDVLSRWLRGEDPTKGLEKFEVESAAAAQASPLAHAVGQGVGLLGIGGFAAEALIARGAAAGAQGVWRQLMTGLKSSLKPTVAGTAAGATFGAVEGALTGRDPLAEAAKFGSLGLLTGLGGVPREQLIAGGLLGGVVGASTAKEHGVEKGLEAGSTVFFLPIVTPMERGISGIVMETARRPITAAGLKAESVPAVEARYAQIVRELAAQVRGGMEKKPLLGLTPEEAAAVAARLRTRPAEQREFFMQLAEDAAAKIRAGDDVVLVQLKLLRDKLDPVSKMRFDEVLRRYGLSEVKHAPPEYSLREEDAPALARLFRRESEYALTDESAKLLNQPPKLRQEPQYALTDAAAQKLNLFLRHRPEYALTDEMAARLDQFFKMPHEVPAFRPVAAEQQPAARWRRVSAEKQEPWFASKTKDVLTGKTEVELVGQVELEPALTRRPELQAPRQEPKLASRAELELRLPEVRTALEYALRPRAETIPEHALTPEIQQVFAWAQEVGRRLAELDAMLKTPRAVQLLKEEPPEKRRGLIVTPSLGRPETSVPSPPFPISITLKMPEFPWQYEVPTVPTSTPTPAADVPPSPTYTPVPPYSPTPISTPQISEVPTVDVQPVPTYDTGPMPQPEPLPPGWWRLIPPDAVAGGREGAYKVQTGKKQILALA